MGRDRSVSTWGIRQLHSVTYSHKGGTPPQPALAHYRHQRSRSGKGASSRRRRMPAVPNAFRIAMSPFEAANGGVHKVLGDLTLNGFLPNQFCLVGTPSSIAHLGSSIGPSDAIYPALSHLVTNLEGVYAPRADVPIVASNGAISDALLRKQLWLGSPVSAHLDAHFARGDVVFAVNAIDHDQFVHAGRQLLRHGSGHLFAHVFQWPENTPA